MMQSSKKSMELILEAEKDIMHAAQNLSVLQIS